MKQSFNQIEQQRFLEVHEEVEKSLVRKNLSHLKLEKVNPLLPRLHQKVTHTRTNQQLSAADLFKYVWPFSEHKALKS